MRRGSPTLPPGAPRAPLTSSGAFMDKDSGIIWGRQLRGPHPQKPHRLPGGGQQGGTFTHELSSAVLSRPWRTAQGWGKPAALGSCFGMSSPTQSQPLRWEPKWDTSASAIHRSHPKDGDPGQGAREKFGSRHRRSVLIGRQTHSLCPESRNFFKACNYRAELEEASRSHAGGTAAQPGPLTGTAACAEPPGRLRGALRMGDVSYATLPLQITRLSRKAVGLDSLLSRISA